MSSEPLGVARPSSRCRRSASQAPPVRMPTRPVDSETPARSLFASSLQRASASGRFIEVAVKDDLRGEGVYVLLVLAAALAALAQSFTRRRGAEPFIGEHHRQPKTGLELPRETARPARHSVLGSVHRQ